MAWTKEEKQVMTKAMAQMYNIAVNRVTRKSMDAAKLAEVAQCMDNHLRNDNHVLSEYVVNLQHEVAKLEEEKRDLVIHNELLRDRVVELEETTGRNIRRIIHLEAMILEHQWSESESEDMLQDPPRVRRRLNFE